MNPKRPGEYEVTHHPSGEVRTVTVSYFNRRAREFLRARFIGSTTPYEIPTLVNQGWADWKETPVSRATRATRRTILLDGLAPVAEDLRRYVAGDRFDLARQARDRLAQVCEDLREFL